jgi:endogenous inhibitor of DNA gyrase (YacG/DUF329 family)
MKDKKIKKTTTSNTTMEVTEEIKCVVCGAPTGLNLEDMEEANPVCSEKCNDIYIKR